MGKTAKVFYNLACIIGLAVGFMHFFVPYSFSWYSYIPEAPIEIYQSINYINFCFSFMLTGISLILILVQRRLFADFKAFGIFYVFFIIVWLSRVTIQMVWPWPSSLQTWLVVGFTLESLFTLIPMVFFMKCRNQ